MKYIPKKMIKGSRFKKFFKALNEEEQEKTLQIMDKLILENKEYADEKNHEYLCNLFSCLALEMMFEENGKSRAESEKTVIEAMHRFVEPSIRSMKILARMPFFVSMLNSLMPIKFEHVAGYGWDIEFPKAERNRFAMTTHRCIFFDIFSKYGRPELTKGFCQVDNILYGALPKTKFSYTERIGEGGKKCDYVFERVKTEEKID